MRKLSSIGVCARVRRARGRRRAARISRVDRCRPRTRSLARAPLLHACASGRSTYGRRFCAGDNSHNSDFAPSRTHVQFSLRHGIFGSSKLSAAARRTREVRCVSQGYPDFSKFDSFVCSSSCCRCSCCCKTSWHTTIHAIPLCGQRATARRTCAGHLCAIMHRETHPV